MIRFDLTLAAQAPEPKHKRVRPATVELGGRYGVASNESVVAGLQRVTEEDDIAFDDESRAGAVVITGINRQHDGSAGRASDVLRAITRWADEHKERVLLTPAASGDLKQADLVAWYERNGFIEQLDGVMERTPVAVSKTPENPAHQRV